MINLSRNLRPRSIVLPLAIVLLLLGATSAGATVKIVAPEAVEAPQKAPYSVTASSRGDRIGFYVDGRRRWFARDFSGQHSGYLSTAGLAPGQHLLTVKVKRGRRVIKSRRNLYVRKKTGHEKGKPAPAPEEPAPAPEESAPAPEESAPAPSGSVLFSSNFDKSFSGWYLQCLPGRASLVSGSSFQGTGNARFEVREGDVEPDTGSSRCEVSGPTFSEGQDIFIRDAFRIPSAATFQGSWQIIQQLHETEWSGSPGMALFLSASHTLQLGAGDGSPTYWKSGQLQTNRWYELIYHVKLSQNSSVGFVEVWLDGAQQTLANGLIRSYGQTMQTGHVYLKAGIYRAKTSTGTSLIEHDDITVGTSLAAAAAL